MTLYNINTNEEMSVGKQLLQTLLMGKVKDTTESDSSLLRDSDNEDYSKTDEASLINKGILGDTKEKYDDNSNPEYVADKNPKNQDMDNDKKDQTKSNNIKTKSKADTKIDIKNKKFDFNIDINTKNLLEDNIEFLKHISDIQQLVNIEKNLESDLEVHGNKVETLRKDISDVENSLEKVYTAIGELEKFLDLCEIEDEHIIDGLHKLVDVFNQGYSLNDDECEKLFVKDCDYGFEGDISKKINNVDKINKVQTKNNIREENLSNSSSDDTNRYLIKGINRYKKSNKSSISYKENNRNSKYPKDEIDNQNSNTEDDNDNKDGDETNYTNNKDKDKDKDKDKVNSKDKDKDKVDNKDKDKDKVNNKDKVNKDKNKINIMKLNEMFENTKLHAINSKYIGNKMRSEKKDGVKTRVKIIKDKIAQFKRSTKK